MSSKTTDLDVATIAKLANLPINSEEARTFETQFAETLDYVKNLDELDTTNVEGTASVTGTKNVFFEDGAENKRLLSPAEATQNATESRFVVPRIM